MAKFKVGQWVHYKDRYTSGVGKIHDIPNDCLGLSYQVAVEPKDLKRAYFNGNTCRNYSEGSIDPWQPKIGDRVRSNNPGSEGEAGKVVQLDYGNALVKFDTWRKGHDGVNLVGNVGKDHWYLPASSLEPLPANAEAAPLKAIVSAQSDAIAEEYGPVVKTEPKFKVGDRVVLRSGAVMAAKDGATGAVGPKGLYGKWIDIRWDRANNLCNGQMDGGYYSSDFDLASPTPAEPTTTAIVCLIEGGQPKPADRPHVHLSREAATKEAKRLADKHVGQEFGVYILADSVITKPTYAHEWQRLAKSGQKGAAIRIIQDITGMDVEAARAAVTTWAQAA